MEKHEVLSPKREMKMDLAFNTWSARIFLEISTDASEIGWKCKYFIKTFFEYYHMKLYSVNLNFKLADKIDFF